jgi:tripartite-type tricarboxylate transporter receptor subunit TctC
MEMNRTQFVALAALLVAAFVWPAKGVAADSDFYSGKTITVYVGRPPGSGADLAVRSFVRYWAQHVPGEPTMIVKNVPGGGGGILPGTISGPKTWRSISRRFLLPRSS